MDLLADFLFLAGLILVPAVAVVIGGFVLGWLERFQPAGTNAPQSLLQGLAALPFAALTAAMVLAPVVVAVWAVIAEEQAVAYLTTVGFALGALTLSAAAASREAVGTGPYWPRMPGVVLTSAVGFFIALTSFLGGALARTLGVQVNDWWRVVVPIIVAVLVGGLAVAAYRKRAAVPAEVDRPRAEAATTQNE